MTPIDPLALAAWIAGILDELAVRYVIGGSVASSLFGEPRSTLDLDIMVDLDESNARRLVGRLRETCYIDEEKELDAVKRRASFNAIHYESAMKIDFFLPEAEPFAREQFERRRLIRPSAVSRELAFYAPEDLVMRKLLWFRDGGEASERQWRDVVGILKTSEAILDDDLMRRLARELRVEGLLARAIADAET